MYREVDGRRVGFYHRSAGRIIGLMSLVRARPASFSVEAETDVVILPLTLEQLDLALRRSATLAVHFASALVRSLARRNLQSIDQQLEIRKAASERIKETDRLAVIGQLAADVAHELNNPLQGIVAYSHLLLERIGEEDPTRDSLVKIAAEADRCRTIVRALLDFSRPKLPQTRPTSLNELINQSLNLLDGQAQFLNIEVHRDLDPDLPSVLVDPGQFQQVLINLFVNAAEAMEGSGRLTIETRRNDRARAIELAVSDTGPGISDTDLERIFDPFFSTKEATHGTGLGLAISHGIVREHSGSIGVESELGVGSTFVIRLPNTAEWP
jgi:two-component system NtrC family sensor kinase